MRQAKAYGWVGVILLMLISSGCARWNRWNTPASEAELMARFQGLTQQPQIGHYKVGDRTLRYLSIGADSLPVTLLLHGAPSSLSSWMGYLRDSSILQHTRLVAVDRPGYGGSDFGRPEPSVQQQSTLLKPLLDSLAQAPGLQVVGSSYGGTLTARLAMDYPEVIDRIVLVSASLDPGSEKIYEISYLIALPGIRQLVPGMLNLANVEKLNHFEQLRDMRPGWSKITSEVTILHGDADDLIYYDNAEFAVYHLTAAPSVQLVTVPKADHGLPWSHPELVKAAILQPWQPQNLDSLAGN